MATRIEDCPNNSAATMNFSPKFAETFAIHERVMEKQPLTGDRGLDFNTIRRDLLTPTDIKGVVASMHIESHNPVYLAKLLERFRNNFVMTGFLAGVWGPEEFNHFYQEHKYALASGMVDPAELGRQLDITRAGPWGDEVEGYTEAKIYIHTTVQEYITGRFYTGAANHTQEPVLREMDRRIARDEYRHGEFYGTQAKLAIAAGAEASKDGEARVINEMVEALIAFEMPGPTFAYEYAAQSRALEAAAQPGGTDILFVAGKVVSIFGLEHILGIYRDPAKKHAIEDKFGIDIMQLVKEGGKKGVADVIKAAMPSFSFPGFGRSAEPK